MDEYAQPVRLCYKFSENIKAEGAELISISGDTKFGANLTRNDLQITFLLLSDSDLQTVSDYNAANKRMTP